MKVSNEDIYKAAIQLIAGAMSGSPYATTPYSRLHEANENRIIDTAIKVARKVAESIEE